MRSERVIKARLKTVKKWKEEAEKKGNGDERHLWFVVGNYLEWVLEK